MSLTSTVCEPPTTNVKQSETVEAVRAEEVSESLQRSPSPEASDHLDPKTLGKESSPAEKEGEASSPATAYPPSAAAKSNEKDEAAPQEKDDKSNDTQDQKAGPALQVQPSEGQTPYSVFTKRQIGVILSIIAVAGFFSPINSNIYFPVIPQLASELGESVNRVPHSVHICISRISSTTSSLQIQNINLTVTM